jgi:hypothetical protein
MRRRSNSAPVGRNPYKRKDKIAPCRRRPYLQAGAAVMKLLKASILYLKNS